MSSNRQFWLACALIAMATLAVFAQTLWFQFINFDDGPYVFENATVAAGLTLETVVRAFTDFHIEWTPLVTLSHALDCRIYGMNPAGFHATNIALHTANALLLFFALSQMTGALWTSAFVAALFAVHPLRAESVAWVSERKDLLSGFFFMCSLCAYIRYVRAPSRSRYAALVALFICGLLSKAIVVTLPCVLLLLDCWPLRRVRLEAGPTVLRRDLGRLFVEKLPLFACSLGSSIGSMISTRSVRIDGQPMPLRWSNAAISYLVYIRQMVFPAHLAPWIVYPSEKWPLWEPVSAAAALLALTALALWSWRKAPYVLIGWLWYLGMLFPVIGLIPLGFLARADRLTYLPQIGLYIAIAWSALHLLSGWRWRRLALGFLAVSVLGTLIAVARNQTSYWRNSETLWRHQIESAPPTALAFSNLGNALLEAGRPHEAAAEYRRALELDPASERVRYNLGNALFQSGRLDESISEYQKALEIQEDAACETNLGIALRKKGRLAESIDLYWKAVKLAPDYAAALNNLGNALLEQGRVDAAVKEYRMAIAAKSSSLAQSNLANALTRLGKLDEAIPHFQTAVELSESDAEAHCLLANALLLKKSFHEALFHFRRALELQPGLVAAQNGIKLALERVSLPAQK